MTVQYNTGKPEIVENTFTFAVEDVEFIQLPAGQGIESVEYDGEIYKPGELIKINKHDN